ncbi:hypothetical protein QL285_029763 [Trifolium repens]|nr:hypothetical protein QL285_029763 [Trifolium repens]
MSNSNSNHYDDTYLVLQYGDYGDNYDYHCEFYMLCGERFENKIKIDWPPPFQEDIVGIYICGTVSINGIFCLNQRYGRRLVLWNPATREYKVIPKSSFNYLPPQRHPCRVLHGFGYDHVTNDYKVIRFIDSILNVEEDIEEENMANDDRSSYETFWEIYSLRSNTWRKLDNNIPNRYYYTQKRGIGVYTNGVCHWWARTDKIPNVEECLVSFNFSSEVLFTTLKPSYLDVSRSFKYVERCLILLNESIALISTYLEMSTIHISILGEFGIRESWTNLFTVTCQPFIEYPIGVGNLNNIVFFRKNDHKLAWIDLNTKMIQELNVNVERYGCQIGKYKKSIFPIMGGMNY